MKKAFKIFLVFIGFIAILLLWYDQSRSFYCLDNERCVTVWKRIGGTCYVIPTKYYGIIKSSDNFIKTTNTSDLDVIWESPNYIIVAVDNKTEIINKNLKEFSIVNYNFAKSYNDSLYTFFDGEYLRYKNDVDYISIDIKESYARDKDGKKL